MEFLGWRKKLEPKSQKQKVKKEEQHGDEENSKAKKLYPQHLCFVLLPTVFPNPISPPPFFSQIQNQGIKLPPSSIDPPPPSSRIKHLRLLLYCPTVFQISNPIVPSSLIFPNSKIKELDCIDLLVLYE
ncbi:hypothetical protein GOBAR_DD08393 [Gossypium barbadense]|nr:hypothetical protein GOBAR_DD08393 [Gossypium barbadense]